MFIEYMYPELRDQLLAALLPANPIVTREELVSCVMQVLENVFAMGILTAVLVGLLALLGRDAVRLFRRSRSRRSRHAD